MQRVNSRKLPYWHQRQIRIIASNGISPQTQGKEEIWIGDRGRAIYWNDRGMAISCDLPPGIPRAQRLDAAFPDVAEAWLWGLPTVAAFEPFWPDLALQMPVEGAIDVEIANSKKPTIWQQLVRRGKKLYQRTCAAMEAAWREFARAE